MPKKHLPNIASKIGLKLRRRTYSYHLNVNGKVIKNVIVDLHYQQKHSESIDDQMILKLVGCLNNQSFVPCDEEYPYFYFKTEPLFLNRKAYRLVWLMEEGQDYIGVINAFRR